MTPDLPGRSPLYERIDIHSYDALVARFRQLVVEQAEIDTRRAEEVRVRLYVEHGTGRLQVRCGFTGSTFYLDWSGQEADLRALVDHAAGESAYLLRAERARDGSTGFEA